MGSTFKIDQSIFAIRNFRIALLIVSGLLISNWAEGNQYEKENIILSASTLLADNVRSGSHYRVRDKVINEGFMNFDLALVWNNADSKSGGSE
jgi:hypothetical protein